ncbi:amidohydrolase [Streptomyces sp. JJ66]|uniref:amidohydrolase family protein n=1 Tax=Streptomyces sp. JJ66 TaxID=2803843 RepID=UPI001C57E226|nr:amidohydrolase family protein [Streptomyces sp. JJ66]MBW1600721.1 amidohydrolase [Streptomyces sp. JJ66]
MIIDAHVHAGEFYRHYTAAFAEEMMATTGMPPEALSAPEGRLLAHMDEAGVDRAFLLAFDVQRIEGFKVPNEFVADICARHPDRFTGFASVDAGTPGAADELRRSITELGLAGLKTAPCYLRMSPADPRWNDVYEVAQELGVPVLVHTGYTPAKKADPRFFSPRLLDRVAADFPELRLILAHLGTPWTDTALDLMSRHPHVYADLSIFSWYRPAATVAAALARARSLGVLDRLLWGTDHPFCTMTDSVSRMRELATDSSLWPDGTALTPAEYASVMGVAAAGLLTATRGGTIR